MISSKHVLRILAFSICGLLCLQSSAFARSGGHHRDWSHHERLRAGYRCDSVAGAIASVVIAGMKIIYDDDGVYYRREGRSYVVIDPPAGTVVRGIPVYYRPVSHNGLTYYSCDGIYYVRVKRGYQLVPAPVLTVVQPAPVVVTQPATVVATLSAAESDSFTVNIPDKDGFTPVVIKKAKFGYFGPQGEFYAEFPSVAQLKVMYGKS